MERELSEYGFEEKRSPVNLTDAQILRLQPGDVLLVEWPDNMDPSEATRVLVPIMEPLGVQVVVHPPYAKFQVARPEKG